MAKDEVVFRVSADEAKALQSFQRLIDKQNQVDNQSKKSTRRVQEQKSAVGGLGMAIKGLAAGAGFASMNQALQTGLGLLRSYDEYLDRIVNQQERLGGSAMRSFVGITPGAAGAQFREQTFRTGAAAGVGIEAAASLMQPIRSISGTDEEAMQRYQFALQGLQIGMEPQSVTDVAIQAAGKGLAPGVAPSQLVTAAAMSARGEATFAKAAPETLDYSDWATAMSSITALSVGVTESKLPEATRAAGRVFGAAGDTSEFSEAYGLAGMSELEKVAELRRQAEETYDPESGISMEIHIEQFTQGFTEFLGEMDRIAAQNLVRQGDLFQETYTAVQAAPVDAITQRRNEILADPTVRTANLEEVAGAREEFEQIYGRDVGRATRGRAQEISTATGLIEGGAGYLVGENMELGIIGRLISTLENLDANMSPLMSGTIQQGASRMEAQSPEATRRVQEQSLEQLQRIADNTESNIQSRNAQEE